MKFLSKLIPIRKGEGPKTWAMFFYFFSIIATIWMLKPVRNSLFLDELGAENLRFVYMGEGFFLIGVAWLFVKFSKILDRKTLFNGVLVCFILCLCGFWFLFQRQVPYLSAVFYIWAASYSIVMTTQFFTLANDIFNPLEAKRLFGFILSGGSIGGVLGGLLTSYLVGSLGTENLLLVIAAIIGLCSFILTFFWKHLVAGPGHEDTRKIHEDHEKRSAPSLLLKSSYLMAIAGLIIIAKMSSAVVDNQFNATVQNFVIGKDARTAFYGTFFGGLNALSFFLQIVMTGAVLKYLGVGKALWILPIGLLGGSAGTLLVPSLMAGIFLKAFDGSTNYSIQQATREVLYLPVPSALRYRVKPIIDMLGYRLAKTFGGMYIAILAPLLGVADQQLAVLVLILLPIWFLLVLKMQKGYGKMLKQSVLDGGGNSDEHSEKEKKDSLLLLENLSDERLLQANQSFLQHDSSLTKKIIAAAGFLQHSLKYNSETTKKALAELFNQEAIYAPENESLDERLALFEQKWMQSSQEQLRAGRKTPEVLLSEEDRHYLESALEGNRPKLKAERKILRILEYFPQQEVFDLLLRQLKSSQNFALRFLILKSLNNLCDKNKEIQIPKADIKTEIIREGRLHDNLRSLRTYYGQHQADIDNEHYLDAFLKALEDEGMERIFCLLSLIHPHEMMRVIYERIVERERDARRSVHAVELLNTLLDADLLLLVQKALDESDRKQISDEDAHQILTSFLKEHDQWLHLMSAFLTRHLKLSEKWPDLEESYLKASYAFQVMD